MSLADTINIIVQVQINIKADKSCLRKAIKKLFYTVSEKNTEFKTMINISSILEGKATYGDNIMSK